MGALSVGDVRTGTIPSLLPSQKHYLKVYSRTACGKQKGNPTTSGSGRGRSLMPNFLILKND
ncbi:MAG: hypothetical protein V1736_07875 [Pseudomonadota bacterium]